MSENKVSEPLISSAVATTSKGDMIKGLSLFSLGITSYSFYTLCVKVAQQSWLLNVPELCYYIQFIGIIMFYGLVRYQGVDHLKELNKPNVKGDLALRVLFGTSADLCLFVAFSYTNYSRAFCIFFTNNLMLPFMAKCLLGEKIKVWDVIGIIAGFSGVLILVQPWKVPEDEMGNNSFADNMIGCGFAVGAAISAALALTFLKRLTNRVNFEVIPFYYCLGSCLLMPLWTLVADPVKTSAELPVYGW